MPNIFGKSKLPVSFIFEMSVAPALGSHHGIQCCKNRKCFLLCFGGVSYSMTENLKSYPTAVSKFDLSTKHIKTNF